MYEAAVKDERSGHHYALKMISKFIRFRNELFLIKVFLFAFQKLAFGGLARFNRFGQFGESQSLDIFEIFQKPNNKLQAGPAQSSNNFQANRQHGLHYVEEARRNGAGSGEDLLLVSILLDPSRIISNF